MAQENAHSEHATNKNDKRNLNNTSSISQAI